MRYPVDDFKSKWSVIAGNKFGQQISANYWHEGADINLSTGGNSDFGEPLYPISKGKIVEFQTLTKVPSFGRSHILEITGPWGTRWVHYAHCGAFWGNTGQVVEENSSVSTVGNSGTTYAHLHLSIAKKRLPINFIAKTKADLENFEDPIAFIEKWINYTEPQQGGTEPMNETELFKYTIALLKDRSLDLVTPDQVAEAQGSNLSPLDWGRIVLRDEVILPSVADKDALLMETSNKLGDAQKRIVELETKLATEHGNQSDFGEQMFEVQKQLEKIIEEKEFVVTENLKLQVSLEEAKKEAEGKLDSLPAWTLFKAFLASLTRRMEREVENG